MARTALLALLFPLASYASPTPQAGTGAELSRIDEELRRLAGKIAQRVESDIEKPAAGAKRTVAVLDFVDSEGRVTELGQFLAERMERIFTDLDSKAITVVARDSLDLLRQEQQSATDGFIKGQEAKNLGRRLGIDALVQGRTTSMDDGIDLAVRAIATDSGAVLGAAGVFLEGDKWKRMADRGVANPTRGGSASAQPAVKYSDRAVTGNALVVGALDSCGEPWTREIMHEEFERVMTGGESYPLLMRVKLPPADQQRLVQATTVEDFCGAARLVKARFALIARCVKYRKLSRTFYESSEGTVSVDLVDLSTNDTKWSKDFNIGGSAGQALREAFRNDVSLIAQRIANSMRRE